MIKSSVDTMAITRGAWLLRCIAFLLVFYKLVFKDGVRGIKRTGDPTSLHEREKVRIFSCDSQLALNT